MTDYDAGAARATYELDIDPLRRSVAEAKRLYAELQQAAQRARQVADPRGSQTVVPRSEAPSARPVGGGRGVDPAAQAQRAEAALLRQARAEATLLAAQGNRAAAATRLERALAGVNQQSLAAIQTRTQLARVSAPDVRPFERLRGGIEGVTGALGALGIGVGVLSAAQAVVQSFADAFRFTAELDASRASINVLLSGVRDSNQVWADGAAYANQYKLTQEELTQALAASTGIMRDSVAPTGQILNVLQRLTVLNPAENIQGAAFAVRELASGDITSIAERFNISRKAAYEMRDAIVAGGDAVQVLDRYLAGVGATSEAVSAKLDGPIGKMRDLAIAQEQLKLAQGEFATGPGLFILERQIDVTRGATRLFTGDWQTMALSLGQNEELLSRINPALGESARVLAQGVTASQQQAAASQQAAQAEAARANAVQIGTAADDESRSALGALQVAQQEAAAAADASAVAKLRDAAQADILAAKHADMEAAILAAAAGSDSAGDAAARLASIYTSVEAPALAELISLLREKAALEGGQGALDAGLRGFTRATRQRAEEREQAAALTAAQRRYIEATETSSARVARLRAELRGLTPGTAAYVDKQTELAQALRTVTAEQQRASTAATRANTRTNTAAARASATAAREAEQEREQARREQEQIEEATRRHYESLRRMQEDYTLSASRRQEDFELEKQRLLAEGRVKEAQLLEERFTRDQRRVAEDQALAVRREREQAAQQIGVARVAAGAAGPGAGAVPPVGATPAAAAAQAAATLAATAAQRPAALTLQVQIAPTTVQIGPEQIVTVTWPLFEQRIDAELTAGLLNVAVTAPPGAGQGSGVGGPTP